MFLCSWMMSHCCKERNTADANIWSPFSEHKTGGKCLFSNDKMQKLTSSWWHLESLLTKVLICSWNYFCTYENCFLSCCRYYVYVLQAVGFFKASDIFVCKAKSVCLWVVLYERYGAGLSWALLQKEKMTKHVCALPVWIDLARPDEALEQCQNYRR